jgi:hypothetical protein
MKLSQIVDDDNNHHPYTDQAAETHYNNDANNITPLPFLSFPSLPLPARKKKTVTDHQTTPPQTTKTITTTTIAPATTTTTTTTEVY